MTVRRGTMINDFVRDVWEKELTRSSRGGISRQDQDDNPLTPTGTFSESRPMTIRSLAVALVLAVAAAPASAQISSHPRVLSPFKAVVAKANESTVQIRGDDKDIALGTVVFSDGFILTKASELRASALSIRFQDGTEFEPGSSASTATPISPSCRWTSRV